MQCLDRIHDASMEILQKVGFKVTSAEIADALERSGIRMEGLIAYFTESQILSKLAEVPGRFTLFARNPVYDMDIGGKESYFAPGYGCTFIAEHDGSKRAALYDDYLRFVKLVHQSDLFSVNGGILVQPADLTREQSIPYMMLATMLLSDKCVLGISSTSRDVGRIMDIAAVIFGTEQALGERPRILTLVNTTSPLELGNIAADTIGQCVKHRQPLIVSPGPMAGATGPVTIAGNLALGNAEALATIALIETLQPGLPVLYGLMPTTMDMARGSVCIGSPVSALQMRLSALLARRYGLPNRCGGSLTDAKRVGVQSATESAMVLQATLWERTSFILHSAGILDSFSAMSYEKFAADLELMGASKRLCDGIECSAEELAVEEIIREGIGGNFLASEHTFEHFRSAGWYGSIVKERTASDGQPEGSFCDIAFGAIDEMSKRYRQPAIDRGLLSDLKYYFEMKLGFGLPPFLD